jgi:hypothetical protein
MSGKEIRYGLRDGHAIGNKQSALDFFISPMSRQKQRGQKPDLERYIQAPIRWMALSDMVLVLQSAPIIFSLVYAVFGRRKYGRCQTS